MSTPDVAAPLFFGPTARPCFGWLHPARNAKPLGIVVCNPFGYEAICAHRSLRQLAESFASAGIPTLRFDYDGTGNSAGDDRDPDRLAQWVESTRHAVAALRQEAAVERVVLVGLRLGALVAALAAQELEIAGLVAIAPIVRGKAYVRELHLLHKALGLAERPGRAATDREEHEAHGFALTAETRAAIGRVDLAKLPRPPAPEVLILDRDDLPGAEPWQKRLIAQNVAVESARIPGYVEMMVDPHKSTVPLAIVRAATEWLAARAANAAVQSSDSAARSLRESATFGEVVERAVFVNAGPTQLFGIHTAPVTKPASGRGIVLLNAGAIHHVGPNRLYVPLARRWAALGDHVLRIDITGLGESPSRSGEPENVVYSAHAVDEVSVAVDWMRRQSAVREVWMVGLCSGAYHALKGARKRMVDGVVVINPLTFNMMPGTPVDFPAARVARDAARYQEAILDPERWKKVFRGEVDVRSAAETVVRRAASRLADQARNLSRRLHMPWKDDVGAELQEIAERGTVQRFVFAHGDPGHGLLQEKAGSVLSALSARGALSIDVIDGPDHTFTQLWSHDPLATMLTAVLDRGSVRTLP